MNRMSLAAIILAACATRSQVVVPIGRTHDGVWVEIFTEYSPSLVDETQRRRNIYYCHEVEKQAVCTLAEFRRNDGSATSP
jgi:hypothetical protein